MSNQNAYLYVVFVNNQILTPLYIKGYNKENVENIIRGKLNLASDDIVTSRRIRHENIQLGLVDVE